MKISRQIMVDHSLIVIGAGAGGLVIAVGAAKAGKKVLLIEKGTYGGDCTNFGCIPSKSLIASAIAAQYVRESNQYGIDSNSKIIQAQKALERVRKIVSKVKSHEEPQALNAKGIQTITGKARFIDPHTLSVMSSDGTEEIVRGKQIVIAVGSSPSIPPIPGLQQSPFLTNETIFSLEKIPKTLVVLGGGPIGCELGQAFQRLGCQVTLIQKKGQLLEREDPEAQNLILHRFLSEQMQVFLNSEIDHVDYENNRFILTISKKKSKQVIESEQLLISTGRKPNFQSLDLESAGIKYSEKGIIVDQYGRTNIHHIWAVGDIVGPPFFTHLAEHQARAVLTSLLLPLFFKKKQDRQSIPRVTYTDPEIASIGLSEKEALRHHSPHSLSIYFLPMSEVDRAVTSGHTEGFVKIITKKWSSKILGATIVGDRAGELLGQISIAMYFRVPLRKLANIIFPYPTYSLAIRKLADRWLTQTIVPALQRILKKKTSDAEKS